MPSFVRCWAEIFGKYSISGLEKLDESDWGVLEGLKSRENAEFSTLNQAAFMKFLTKLGNWKKSWGSRAVFCENYSKMKIKSRLNSDQ